MNLELGDRLVWDGVAFELIAWTRRRPVCARLTRGTFAGSASSIFSKVRSMTPHELSRCSTQMS